MKIQDIVNWMESRKEPNGDYSILNAKTLLKNIDTPQNKIKIVHVAGTNGKGSTVSYISNALIESGLKVGAFISPYIEDVNESIKINGIKISDDDFVSVGKKIMDATDKADSDGFYPTYFDILSSIAYEYFYEKDVDVAVIEVGMGGRMDSTNTMDAPLASVITSISLDHTNFLGDTIAKIAHEKAGIIKEGVPVFCYDLHPDARAVVEEECKLKNTSANYIDKYKLEIIEMHEGGSKFVYKNNEYEISLSGEHQIYNAMLAIDVLDYLAKYFKLNLENIKTGLKQAKNIARLETISSNPHIILDGSHNLEGIIALKKFIQKLKYNRLILGFSVLGDKDYVHIVDELFPMADTIIVTEIDSDRKLPIDELTKIANKYHKNVISEADNKKAYLKSLEFLKEGDALLWCGSLYLMKSIRPIALDNLKR